MRAIKEPLLCSILLIALLLNAASEAVQEDDRFKKVLAIATELHLADWGHLDVDSSAPLVHRHFGKKSVKLLRPGPDEDAASLSWRGDVQDGVCIWCVVLLMEKPSRGGKLQRVNFFFSGSSTRDVIPMFRELISIVAPTACSDDVLKELVTEFSSQGHGRHSCWNEPGEGNRDGVDIAISRHGENWVGFVSYWKH